MPEITALLTPGGRLSTIDLPKMARRNAKTYEYRQALKATNGRRLRKPSPKAIALARRDAREIEDANRFVTAQHLAHTADYSPGFPYYLHVRLAMDNALQLLEALAKLGLLLPEEKTPVLKAALAHDVVEDTPQNISTRKLAQEIGVEAAMLVHRVTKADQAQRALLDEKLIRKLWGLTDQQLEQRRANERTHPRVANLCADLLERKQNALDAIQKATEESTALPIHEFTWLREGPLPSYELQELRKAHRDLWRAIYIELIAHYDISERRRIAASHSANNAFGRVIHDTEQDLIGRFGRRGASFFLGAQTGVLKLADFGANLDPTFPLTDDPQGPRHSRMDLFIGDLLTYALTEAQHERASAAPHQRAHLTMTCPVPSSVKAVVTDGKVSWSIAPALSPDVLRVLQTNWSVYAERFLRKALKRNDKYLLDTKYLAQQWKGFDSNFIASALRNDPSRPRLVSSRDVEFHTGRYAFLHNQATQLHRGFQKKEAWLKELSSQGDLGNALRLDSLRSRISGLPGLSDPSSGVSSETSTDRQEVATTFSPALEPLERAV